MPRTKVSSKYQVVIPKEVRDSVGVKPGQVFQIVVHGEVISLIPDRPLSHFRGFAKGASTKGIREKKDRM